MEAMYNQEVANKRRAWERDEVILALYVYFNIPFGKIRASTPEIIKLSNALGRTPSAVALKLANLAAHDPALAARGVRGMTNGAKLDKEVWDEYYQKPDIFLSDYMKVLENFPALIPKEDSEASFGKKPPLIPGTETFTQIKTRIYQNFFRQSVLSSFGNRCCISGIVEPCLLEAAHIIPWAKNERLRLEPTNGLALNCLLHKAFDENLIGITPDYSVRVSKTLLQSNSEEERKFFTPYEGKLLHLESVKRLPEKTFLEERYSSFLDSELHGSGVL